MNESQPASLLQMLGAGGFGAVIGWNLYYINRYRKENTRLSDLATLIGVLGGGAVLALFPARSDMFGAFGIGLGVGFFLYFLVLVVMVRKSTKYGVDFFIDASEQRGMGQDGHDGPNR